MLSGIFIGFAVGLIGGILFEAGRNHFREQNLLDRISWRNPSDYWFMSKERDKYKPTLMDRMTAKLTKKDKEPLMHHLDPQAVAKSIEDEVKAAEFGRTQYSKFLKQREEAAKTGAFI